MLDAFAEDVYEEDRATESIGKWRATPSPGEVGHGSENRKGVVRKIKLLACVGAFHYGLKTPGGCWLTSS